jgi:hypothetical protein
LAEQVPSDFGMWLLQHLSPTKVGNIIMAASSVIKFHHHTRKGMFFDTTDPAKLQKIRADIEGNRIFKHRNKKKMENIS